MDRQRLPRTFSLYVVGGLAVKAQQLDRSFLTAVSREVARRRWIRHRLGRTYFPGLRAFLGSLACLTWLTGCSPATMSVEEAKKVTTSFQGAAFVPPPRTIQDITAILDQTTVETANLMAASRAKAEAPTPANASPSQLAQFLLERGTAAQRIGQLRQAKADLEQALVYARQASSPVHRILYRLAVVEEQGSQPSQAIAHLREAERAVPASNRGLLFAIYRVLVWSETRMGDLAAAERTLSNLLKVESESLSWPNAASADRTWWSANVAITKATVARARGRLSDAETLYRQAAAQLDADPVQAGTFNRDLAHSHLSHAITQQGRQLEAENEARIALLGTLRRNGRNSPETAVILATLTDAILAQSRATEAEALARTNIDIWEKVGAGPESIFLAINRSQLAMTLVDQGRWEEAAAEFERIRAGLQADPAALRKWLGGGGVWRTHNSIAWALAVLESGRPAEADRIIDSALRLSREIRGEHHPVTAVLRGCAAMALAAQGDRERALAEFGQAIVGLDEMTGRVGDEEDADEGATPLSRFVERVLTAYITLLAQVQGTSLERKVGIDAAAASFRLADLARSHRVRAAINAAAVRASVREVTLADLVRRDQDARKQLGALHGELRNLLSLPPQAQNQAAIAKSRRDVDTLRNARRIVSEQIARQFPEYARLTNPPPITVDEARAALRPGEALIATYVTDRETYVWMVPPQGTVAFVSVPLGRGALQERVAVLRKALDPTARTLGDIPAFDVVAAHELYRQLLEPVKAGWSGAESLIVVADGPLSQLPFALLATTAMSLGSEAGAVFSNYRRIPWLIRTHAITVLPSITSLATLHALPAGDPTRRRFVGFGDPWFSEDQAQRAREAPRVAAAALDVGALDTRNVAITLRRSRTTEDKSSAHLSMLPRLPETADELRSIARAMDADPTRDVFTGPQASEKTVKSINLAGYRVIAFATHGLVPGDLDGLTQPALALSAPSVADSDGDGLLTMEEILALRLNADWVVLSACNTAAGHGAGSEAISGLGRAFFYAGARSLLVSNWPVETTSAKALTTELFRRQSQDPTLTRAKALQQTMNALIDGTGLVDPNTNRVIFSYAHPIFWAPFTLVGDGGR